MRLHQQMEPSRARILINTEQNSLVAGERCWKRFEQRAVHFVGFAQLGNDLAAAQIENQSRDIQHD
jgi:hypothetical protein